MIYQLLELIFGRHAMLIAFECVASFLALYFLIDLLAAISDTLKRK
jgi:hypothetical protein